jgi:hypothetical protein
MSNSTIPAAPSTITSGYTYRGFRYEPGEDREDDNIKIWHDVVEESVNLCTDMLLHFSPYKTPTVEEFHATVDEYIAKHPKTVVLPKPGNIHVYYWCSLTGPKGKEIVGDPMIVRVRPDGYVEFTFSAARRSRISRPRRAEMKIYICNEDQWDDWRGAPVRIIKKLKSPPASPNVVEIENVITGETYVVSRSYLSPAKPGMVKTLAPIIKIRQHVKNLSDALDSLSKTYGIRR